MKPVAFKSFWQSNYPEAYPIGHELKWIYSDRWFRIHSLPESKRYAETAEEYQLIFEIQNELITNLVGEGTELILLTGLYGEEATPNEFHEIESLCGFSKVEILDLHKIKPEEYEETLLYNIFIKKVNWESNKYNELLKLIADDEFSMMFICPDKNRIINPYDGGVDIIMETKLLRDKVKQIYHQWLSKHPEGL